MSYRQKSDPLKNTFPLPNEIFLLGLCPGELAVYAFLRHCENRKTHQCWPSYKTIGKAVGMTENTVAKYVSALECKGLIQTESTSVMTKDGIKRNGNLLYTSRQPNAVLAPVCAAVARCGLHRCAKKKYVAVLITLAVSYGYSCRAVICSVTVKEGHIMYDYMRALEDRFNPKSNYAEQRQELEAKRQTVSALLDKQGRKKLLPLVDAHTAVQEEMALSSFIAGFRLAWGSAMELGADSKYSYEQEQEQINRLKN